MNELFNVAYNERDSVMRQIDVLFKDIPADKKVEFYEELFNLQAKERDAIRQAKAKEGNDALKEELAIITAITNQIDALAKERYYAYQNQKLNETREEGLPKNVLK